MFYNVFLQDNKKDTISVLGKGAVGKTSLIFRYTQNKFPKEHDPTVEDYYKVDLKTKSGEVKEFTILDTAGEEDYQVGINSWIAQAKGFILVFAINDTETFNYLKKIYEQIKKHEADNLPIVVIGNKCDLAIKRTVSTQQGEDFAKSIGAKYFETSALTDYNQQVKVAFEACAYMILNKAGINGERDKCCCSIF